MTPSKAADPDAKPAELPRCAVCQRIPRADETGPCPRCGYQSK